MPARAKGSYHICSYRFQARRDTILYKKYSYMSEMLQTAYPNGMFHGIHKKNIYSMRHRTGGLQFRQRNFRHPSHRKGHSYDHIRPNITSALLLISESTPRIYVWIKGPQDSFVMHESTQGWVGNAMPSVVIVV